jgi:hypothetical protein
MLFVMKRIVFTSVIALATAMAACSEAPVEPAAVAAPTIFDESFEDPQMNGALKVSADLVVADAAFIAGVSLDEVTGEATITTKNASATPGLIKPGDTLLAVSPGPGNPDGFIRGVLAVEQVGEITKYKLSTPIPWWAMYESGTMEVHDGDINWDKSLFQDDGTNSSGEVAGLTQQAQLRTLGLSGKMPPTAKQLEKWGGRTITHENKFATAKLTSEGQFAYHKPKFDLKLGFACGGGWKSWFVKTLTNPVGTAFEAFDKCKFEPKINVGLEFYARFELSLSRNTEKENGETIYLIEPQTVATWGGVKGFALAEVTIGLPVACSFDSSLKKIGFKSELWGDPKFSTVRRDGKWNPKLEVAGHVHSQMSLTGALEQDVSVEGSCELTPEVAFRPLGIKEAGPYAHMGPKVKATWSSSCPKSLELNANLVLKAGVKVGKNKDQLPEFIQKIENFSLNKEFALPVLGDKFPITLGAKCVPPAPSEIPVDCKGKADGDYCTAKYGRLFRCLNGEQLGEERVCKLGCSAVRGQVPTCSSN